MTPVRPSVTVVQHDAEVPLGRFAGWLEGVDVHLVRAFSGESVPSTAGEGLLVLGGRMDAYDDVHSPWLPATRRLIADSVAAGAPVLGICLGLQLLAVATGGEVAVPAPAGREAGLVELTWAAGAATDPVLAAVVGEVHTRYQYAMHSDAVTRLPPGAVCLASSEQYPVQALRVGSALGVQFHPEASPARLARWSELNGSQADPAVEAAVAGEHDDAISRVGREIARAFAAEVLAGDRRVAARDGGR